ncbi:hypothetical protein DFO77_107140 [Marinilabilia salmonicolor]|uniref:Uncharacterized protein n=1 Tax=Marinilabilia salmonicolor TaxID=989 RepID=A0A2T0XEM5_9BACT|nr:hypothetical protein BY457_1126 [Marinilabilia salmonicolor]RCW36849.1 hypothetical protein DFO77_107140 [Marinilabilia salmonicolor]
MLLFCFVVFLIPNPHFKGSIFKFNHFHYEKNLVFYVVVNSCGVVGSDRNVDG